MSRAFNRGLPVLRALVLLGVGGVWAIACGGPQPLGGAGSVCFRADECQPGLACVPETEGATKHVCSADLSGIVSMVDGAAPEAGEMPDGMGGAPAQAGGPATAGAPASAGTAGKPATGGAPGTAGSPATAGAPAAAGAPAGGSHAGGASAAGAPAAGAPAAGAPAGGSSAAGSASGGAENGGASAGTGG